MKEKKLLFEDKKKKGRKKKEERDIDKFLDVFNYTFPHCLAH